MAHRKPTPPPPSAPSYPYIHQTYPPPEQGYAYPAAPPGSHPWQHPRPPSTAASLAHGHAPVRAPQYPAVELARHAAPQQVPPPMHPYPTVVGRPPRGTPHQHVGGFAPAPAPTPAIRPDATAGVSQRVRFIRLTYLHLLAAILAFASLLYVLMTNEPLVARVSLPLVRFALGGRANWAIVLAAFMAISWVADYWASHASSRALQYAGLAFYVVAEALIFVPLLAIVEWKTQAILARGGAEPHIMRDAAVVTLAIFTALTLSVFLSRKDFSFLRSGLFMASGAALSLIAMSLAFGFNLGLAFSVGMVLLAAGYVLFQTSQVLAHHDPRRHVAAALALFSSIALMFWYVIRIFLRARQ